MYVILNIINLISLIVILFFVIKLFKFSIPIESILWSDPNSKYEFLRFGCKIFLVLLLNIDFTTPLSQVFLIFCFLLWLLNLYIEERMISIFNWKLSKVYNIFNVLILLILFQTLTTQFFF